MKKARILVVDDEQGMLEVCGDTLSKLPSAEVVLENESPKALERLAAEPFDLLVTDLKMPVLSGVELLREAREHSPDLAALMITAFPTVETAVECMKLGAADYVTKPFIPGELLETVKRLLDEKRLRDENRLLRRQVESGHRFDDIVGKSPGMQKVFETIARVAEADVDALVVGDTGVGKELVARSIHRRSKRNSGPFIPVDCGAIPENLLESELFGHERGAFTGADRQSMGLLEIADGGTFFLDEVAELPLPLQAKLLRALQERTFRRVGGKEEIEVDVRILAATNRDLPREVSEGRFREDLYYRIHVVRIDIPALRDRKDDIPLLVDYFAETLSREMGKDPIAVTPEAGEVLTHYEWPGNVRELQNVLKRALTMASGDCVRVEDLAEEIIVQAGVSTPGGKGGFFGFREQRIAAFEKEYLSHLLAGCHGDVSRAAREAQMPRGTLYRLLRKLELVPEDFRE